MAKVPNLPPVGERAHWFGILEDSETPFRALSHCTKQMGVHLSLTTKASLGQTPLLPIQLRTESGQERLSFQLTYLLLEALGLYVPVLSAAHHR